MTTRSAVAADELTRSGDFLVAYRRLEMSMATSLSTTPSFQLANGNVVSLDLQSRGPELLKDVRSKIASFCDTLVSGSLCSAFESKRYLAPDVTDGDVTDGCSQSSNHYWMSHSMEAETEGIAMAAPAAEDMPPSSAASFNETIMMDERNRVDDLLVETLSHSFDLGLVLAAALENPKLALLIPEAILDAVDTKFRMVAGVSQGSIDELKL
ncbi:hypothetical protein JCM5296_007583, partial [Sporobolomyces johnsonii]